MGRRRRDPWKVAEDIRRGHQKQREMLYASRAVQGARRNLAKTMGIEAVVIRLPGQDEEVGKNCLIPVAKLSILEGHFRDRYYPYSHQQLSERDNAE